MFRRLMSLLASVLLIAGFGAVVGPLPAEAETARFLETLGFATKTGYRGVFTWSTSVPVAGVVHYGTVPGNLDKTLAAPGVADTAQLAITDDLEIGKTYWYQVEDTVSGARSELKSFQAVNAYNDVDGDGDGDALPYTLDLVVQLDTQSLPPEMPADLALQDIAAGINVFAERVHDALDGHARLGTVLVTDTNLDYAANIPFGPQHTVRPEAIGTGPVPCVPGANLADVLVQTTVPFDSHTFAGWAIEKPCVSFYVGRLGQLVVPWEDDLHFGAVAAHEMMHYGFNAPDLYPANSDADCRNLDWDGSLMHNTGGYENGRWEMTELDRNPDLTPCKHGTEPYSWDALRERYREVPLNEKGPIDHVVDVLPRGNEDGGALDIRILDREPGASQLSAYAPDDTNPEKMPCTAVGPQIVDPEGDASGYLLEPTPLPSAPSLDVTEGRLSWDGESQELSFHIRVSDLSADPPPGSQGEHFDFSFTFAGDDYYVAASRTLLGGEQFVLGRLEATREPLKSGLAGSFDQEKDQITVVLPAGAISEARPSEPVITQGDEISGLEIVARRDQVVLVPNADTAPGECSYQVGQEAFASNRPPVAVDDEASTSDESWVAVPVLANDADPDGDALSVLSVTQPSHGETAILPDGTVGYRPTPGFAGADVFDYTASDGRFGTDSARVTVMVTAANAAPVAATDRAAASWAPVRIQVLANDSDPEGDAFTLTGVTPGRAGSTALDGDSVVYTPSPAFTDTDSFTYSVEDVHGASATGTVEVHHADLLVSLTEDMEPSIDSRWRFDPAVNRLDEPLFGDNLGAGLSATWQVAPDPRARSPRNSLYSPADSSGRKDDRIVSPELKVFPSTTLSFWHRFSFDEGYDGGVLEVSTNGGRTWRDVVEAGGTFLQGAYSGEIQMDSPAAIAGRRAWTGTSPGGMADMGEVGVDLGRLSGSTVQLRWRLATDFAVPGGGWWIDDVTVSDVLVGPTSW